MKDEIAAAVVFLTQLVKKNPHLTEAQVDQFQNNLASVLLERFKNHWYQTTPTKGQGYRCIRINDTEPVDPVLETAAKNSGMKYVDLGLPNELTLWVDPSEVSCRSVEVNIILISAPHLVNNVSLLCLIMRMVTKLVYCCCIFSDPRGVYLL